MIFTFLPKSPAYAEIVPVGHYSAGTTLIFATNNRRRPRKTKPVCLIAQGHTGRQCKGTNLFIISKQNEHTAMDYRDYESAFSRARLGKYLIASSGDAEKAIILYRCNISLSQKFYPLLNVFEVVLRNAINAHYKKTFSDSDWIRHQLVPNGMLENHPHRETVVRVLRDLDVTGYYSSDRVVSSMTLGFWIHLFSRRPFALGGQSILRIFPQKDKGIGQRTIYNELKMIKTFRNRVAHHEAICFDQQGFKSSAPALSSYLLLMKYARYLGFDETKLYDGLDINPNSLLKQIDNL